LELIKCNQSHICTTSCWKYCRNLSVGERRCRYKYPRDHQESFEILVKETVNELGQIRYTMEILHQRTTSQDMITNAYNVLSLLCWRANIDLQFIANPYAAAVYCCKYVSKTEKEDTMALTNGVLVKLRQYIRESTDTSVVKKVLNSYLLSSLTHREVGMQEIAWNLLAYPLVQSTRKIIKLNVLQDEYKYRRLKSAAELFQLPEDSTDVFSTKLSDLEKMVIAYQLRPQNSNFNEEENNGIITTVDDLVDCGNDAINYKQICNNKFDWENLSLKNFIT
jgi:hypothetical protein